MGYWGHHSLVGPGIMRPPCSFPGSPAHQLQGWPPDAQEVAQLLGEGPSAILTPGSVASFSMVESVLLEGKLVQREAIRAKLASYQLARVLCTWPLIGDRRVLSGRPALALAL